MDSVFANLIRGGRLSAMGLQMADGQPFRYAKDYTYVEIPFGEAFNISTEELQKEAKRNQHLKLIPAARVNLKAPYKMLVKTHPSIQKYASCPPLFLLDPDEGGDITFYSIFRKDMNLIELPWLVRLYLII